LGCAPQGAVHQGGRRTRGRREPVAGCSLRDGPELLSQPGRRRLDSLPEGLREVVEVGHDVLTHHLGALVRRHRIEFLCGDHLRCVGHIARVLAEDREGAGTTLTNAPGLRTALRRTECSPQRNCSADDSFVVEYRPQDSLHRLLGRPDRRGSEPGGGDDFKVEQIEALIPAPVVPAPDGAGAC
jgi:hypothetical protein